MTSCWVKRKKKVVIWVGQRIGGKCRNAEKCYETFSLNDWVNRQSPRLNQGAFCWLVAWAVLSGLVQWQDL